MDVNKTFSDNMRKARLAKGWSLEKLAEATKSSKSYIWEIEKNPTNIGLQKSVLIADALDQSLMAMIGQPSDLQTENAVLRSKIRGFRGVMEGISVTLSDI